MHSMLNLEVGELKQQIPHNQCHSCQLRKGHRDTLHAGSQKMDSKKLEKICLVW